MNSNNFAIIMAGGIGSRFWPYSRIKKPKQFQDFMGSDYTLIQLTFNRLKKIIPRDNIFILTNKLYKKLVKEQIRGINESRILLEPEMKNTAPCILYASLKIKKVNPMANVIVAPSDHWIEDEKSFVKNIELAFDLITIKPSLVTFGIRPNRPDTGYGYLKCMNIKNNSNKILLVDKFIEKPNLLNAKKYLKSEKFLWNSGIFVWKNFDILSEFKKFQPKMFKILNDGYDLFDTKSEKDFINQNYSLLDEISIDFAIMEKTKNCYSIIADFDWSDLGTWTSLLNKSEKDENSNFTLKKNIYMEDVSGSLVYNKSDKLIVVNGLKDFIVVLDNDVLLIYPKGDDQKLKNIVKNVKKDFGDKM